MKNIAVVLSGCGFKDGTEITESVSLMISLSKFMAQYQLFSPNSKFTATNHMTGECSGERNIIEESARIARGNVKPLEEMNPSDFDALAFPGGYGAATHLCNWATKGAQSTVNFGLENQIKDFYSSSKPILALCIAPVLLALVLGEKGITLTIGNDAETSNEIQKTGTIHENCDVTDYVTDREHKLITSPAYMYGDSNPYQIYQGIQKAAREFVEMA